MVTPDRDELRAWADRHIWPDDRDKFITWSAARPDGWEPEHANPLFDEHWSAFAEYAQDDREATDR